MTRNRVKDRTWYYSEKDYYNGTEAVISRCILEDCLQICLKPTEIRRHWRGTDHVNKKRVGEVAKRLEERWKSLSSFC